MVAAVETMAYNRVEKPWHGLGVPVDNTLTTEEMMKVAGLDWTVSVHPLIADYNGEYLSCGKNTALVRDSDRKVLDIISDNWNPTQNADAFEFFREYVEAGDMTMETAGSLNGGKNIWALAKTGEAFETVKGDVVEGYILFSNPHRYGQAINVKNTSVRVVCANTLALALQGVNKMSTSVNHAKKFDADAVKNELGIAKNQLETLKEKTIYLTTKRFTQDNLVEFVNKIFPTTSDKKEISKPAQTVLDVVNTQPGAEFGEGSWWQALNAVTYAADHKLGRNDDSRLNSAWFGVNERRKLQALNLALEMADAA